MIDSWHSYPSIYNIGHKAIEGLFDSDVIAEEKIDGSQFSFGLFDGEMRYKSKGAMVYEESPGMFQLAVDSAARRRDLLVPGWTYRAEFLMKPKHNTLKYERVPKDNLIVFDINNDHESYLLYEAKHAEAERIGLECVQALMVFGAGLCSADAIRVLLDTDSMLGGTKIEGVVCKPIAYDKFGPDKKVLMAKYVSETFKEIHGKEWKINNPGRLDLIENLVSMYKTEARWQKAVQHLREAGKIEGSPRDIGAIIAEVREDVIRECADEIKDKIYKWCVGRIQRGVSSGVAEWYKDKLMEDGLAPRPDTP